MTDRKSCAVPSLALIHTLNLTVPLVQVPNGFSDMVPKLDGFNCEKTVKTNPRDVNSTTWLISFNATDKRHFLQGGTGYTD